MPYPHYVNEMWESRVDDTWKIEWFDDTRIISFFKENPLPEFPNIVEVFHSFKDGGHKTDLFRYYYLYLNGGFFIDSDLMVHMHMNDIYPTGYDHLLVHTPKEVFENYHPTITTPCIFNGLIGCIPKSQLIYDALNHAYNVDAIILDKQRLYFVHSLYLISEKYKNNYNIKTFFEYILHKDAKEAYIRDGNNCKISTHYFVTKTIPKELG
jgi:hypothetical protein